ncbi:MAG: VWA domain-containing protein [Desulfobacteraceae bacterium]|nr:VWA domain-containing protein [Desulfobacteraceae bacterium]
MFIDLSSARKVLRMGTILCLVIFSRTVMATDPSSLEGTAGHAKMDSLSALEGTVGHAVTAAQQEDDGIICQPGALCLETATQLPLRVLPRPFSNLYRETTVSEENIILANVPAFHPLYVFARQGLDLRQASAPLGWYQVGRSRDKAEGWLQAKDALEWRQALLVSYTHPGNPLEGRRPVLMFRDRPALEAVIDDMDMAGKAKAIYAGIDSGNVPENIISMEPKRFVDITRQFYLLPILQWSQTQIEGDDVRLLQLAAAVPRSRGADTLENSQYLDQAQVGRTVNKGKLQEAKTDIVFVIDTSRSMQPFIDMTREAVARMTKSFSAETADRFRFGLVAFRDSLDVAPQLEYVTRNFTPELVEGEQLVEILAEKGRATSVGSVDYAEEAFAGVDAALHSKWRDGALRFVIFIGDASSHPKGHPQNTTGKDEADLRREYDDAQVHLFAIHLQDPRAAEDHPRALAQFSHLARVRGAETSSAIKEINAFEEDQYRTLVEHLTSRINDQLSMVTGEQPVGDSTPLAEFDKLWEAALIEYVGKEATPPKDIVAWTLDRDLLNPADKALEVRVLVTREQLSSLAQALDQVVQALMRAEVTQGQFFAALQGVAGQTMKRPEDIGGGARLADTGLLPAFIESLPYKSDILSLTEEMFASMTAEQRSQLEWSILAKLDQYRTINEQVDAWFRVNDADQDQDLVYPLHLDYLP